MKISAFSLFVLFVVSVTALADNPIITDTFTADPAALVVGDTVYLYVGHDQANPNQGYTMHEWLCYSSKDMVNWESLGSPLKPTDFEWASDGAWAAEVEEKDGRYYWFVTTDWKEDGKKAIGVAVSDSPTGPFKDAIGKPLITRNMTPDYGNHGWEDIDPTVYTDDDGTSYLFWGNRTCYYAKLKPSMIELDGPIHKVDVPTFEEAPWIHKRGDIYYLTYASDFPEKVAYATSDKITGPWTPRGLVAEGAGNSNTIHPAIIHFKGKDYFFYHTGMMPRPMMGGSFRRAVCIDYLHYNDDGTMQLVVQTSKGVDPVLIGLPTEADMAAYLMVYFSDSDHSLHMALSSDGYSFTALNNNKPVIDGGDIAQQKGIRDPHITRGPDGAFYLAMTDLHIFAQREGLRDTEWERDGRKYGWGNNRGLVLMKSADLINWSGANIRVDKAFPGFEEIGCAWAPETVYDPDSGRMMIYFTIRFGVGLSRVYYSYVNDDFNQLLTSPEVLFEYPRAAAYLDSDITKVGDQYHMFYVSHDGTPGIKHAASDTINWGYRFEDRWIDDQEHACEAPNLWKRIGEDKWVLMYDCYGINPHNFAFSETSDFKTYTHLGYFNQGIMKSTNFTSPKHGAVIHLTQEEADRLAEHWGLESY